MEGLQGAKKVSFTACYLGKLQLACTSPQIISTSPKTLFDQQDSLQSFCNLNFPKKQHLPVGQVENRNHQPDRKIHQFWAIGHDFLCMLGLYPRGLITGMEKVWQFTLFLLFIVDVGQQIEGSSFNFYFFSYHLRCI